MILIILFAFIALCGVALIGYVSWWLWKKGPYGRVAAIAITALLIYQVVIATFPSSSFYQDEFSYRTGIAMPPSAEIKFKKASYPDFHGDYAADMLFEVSKEDFAWLERAIKVNPPTGSESIGGMYWREAEAVHGKKLEPSSLGAIRQRKSDQRGSWALLKDGKTVYFWFVQT